MVEKDEFLDIKHRVIFLTKQTEALKSENDSLKSRINVLELYIKSLKVTYDDPGSYAARGRQQISKSTIPGLGADFVCGQSNE